MPDIIKKALIRLAAGALPILLYLWGAGFFSGKNAEGELLTNADLLRLLADGFVLSGLLMLCIAGILFVKNKGAFHGIGYSLKHAGRALSPFRRQEREETYAAYRERALESGPIPVLPWLLPALLYFAAGTLLTVIYMVKYA